MVQVQERGKVSGQGPERDGDNMPGDTALSYHQWQVLQVVQVIKSYVLQYHWTRHFGFNLRTRNLYIFLTLGLSFPVLLANGHKREADRDRKEK